VKTFAYQSPKLHNLVHKGASSASILDEATSSFCFVLCVCVCVCVLFPWCSRSQPHSHREHVLLFIFILSSQDLRQKDYSVHTHRKSPLSRLYFTAVHDWLFVAGKWCVCVCVVGRTMHHQFRPIDPHAPSLCAPAGKAVCVCVLGLAAARAHTTWSFKSVWG